MSDKAKVARSAMLVLARESRGMTQEAALIGNAGEPILPLPLVVRAEETAKLDRVGDLSEQPKAPRGSVSTSGKAAT